MPTTESPPKRSRFWLYALATAAASFFTASGWIMEEEYTLTTEVDAGIDDVFSLLTNVTAIAEVHPQLRGITRVLSEQRLGSHGAIIEWELATSAMWSPPWWLQFLREMKTYEHVSTTAALDPGVSGRVQNVGIKGNRGKLVPFYYLHWWQLEALGPSRTRLTDYELLKGSASKPLTCLNPGLTVYPESCRTFSLTSCCSV